MNQIKSLFILAMLTCIAGAKVHAYDAQIDGIYYNFVGNEATVTYQEGGVDKINKSDYAEIVRIPETVTYRDNVYRVTKIGDRAFEDCTNLLSVIIPSSVHYIGEGAFENDTNLKLVEMPISITIIERWAFFGCTSLESLELPESIKEIGDHTFGKCQSLRTISIPKGVTTIGQEAFTECGNLESVIMPSLLVKIEYGTFYGCSSLTSITIPASVTNIDPSAFFGCEELTSMTVESGNTVFDSRNNCNAIIETSSNKLVRGCKTTKIPDTVTCIGELAFYSIRSITSMFIGPNITKIEGTAFGGCKGITSLEIPSTVEEIGDFAFAEMDLITMTVDKVNCDNMFYWFGPPDYETTVQNLIIGSHVSSLYLDYYDLKLETIRVADGNVKFDSRDGCNAMIETSTNKIVMGCKNTTIPNSVTAIGEGAFRACGHDLTSLDIPDGITSIENYAFARTGLSIVEIPSSVTSIGGDGLFSGCDKLEAVILPPNVTSIGYSFFGGCSSLKVYNIPSSVTKIGEYAFSGCNSLKQLYIPSNVTTIGKRAFYDCSSLNEINIPSNVTNIGEYTFWGCDSLTSITIPSSVTNIDKYAFDCRSLTDVTVLAELPITLNSYAFYNRQNATLHVPSGCKAAYEVARYWKEFKDIVEIEDDSDTDITLLDNAVYVEPTEARCGGETVLSVKMKNDVAIQTLQFDLYLPEGVAVVLNEDDELLTASTERIRKFNYFQSATQSDGAIRLLAQATTANVPAGDGEICRLTINVPDDMAEGDYPVIIKNTLMVEKDNTSHSPEPNEVRSTLTVLQYTPGDVNNDAEVNAIDFNMIGNHILSQSQAGFNLRAADMNSDGEVNAIDFNMVGNLILGGGNASSRTARTEALHDPS